MISLSGLSAVYPGYMAQEDQTAKTEANQAAAKEAAFKLLGAHVLGRALTGAQPGTPAGGPQPPAPGQPSMPNQPPASPAAIPQPMAQAVPQGGPPAASQPAVPAPAPGPAGAPPSLGGSGLPEMNLKDLTARILQTSPQVANHPEVLLAALERAAPILDRQSKEDLAELRKEMTTKRLESAAEIAKARQEGLNSYRQGQGDRADRRLNQNDTREARLAANSTVRNDASMQRLEMQKQDLQRKIEQGGDKQALAQWRAVVDAQHKRASEIIQSNAFGSNLSKDDRRALLDEQRAAYETEIAAMRGKMTAPPAAPGEAPAPADPPVPGGPAATPAAPASPATPSAPPIAMLKPNTITTFANGQKWTIGPDGQPKQVP